MAPALAEPAQEAEEAKECLWTSCADIFSLPSSFSSSPTTPAPSSLLTSHSSIPDSPCAVFQRPRARAGFWHPELCALHSFGALEQNLSQVAQGKQWNKALFLQKVLSAIPKGPQDLPDSSLPRKQEKTAPLLIQQCRLEFPHQDSYGK